MPTFMTHYFEADNMEDALSQVLFSPSIPKNVQKIAMDIINNFPEQRTNSNAVHWITNEGDILECYKTPKGYEFGLESNRLSLPHDFLIMSCFGRIDQSNAIPPTPLKGSPEDKIFQYEQLIKGRCIERGALFNANGDIMTYGSGDENNVSLPSIGNSAVYITHSHPDVAYADADAEFRRIHFGTSFSYDDFAMFLTQRNLKQVRVVFSNGVVMVCEKTKPKLTNADVNQALKILSRNTNLTIDKIEGSYTLSHEINPNDSWANRNRKYVKYSYELDKSTAANIGLHIYFYLKDGRLVEHLKGKKTTVKRKPVTKRAPVNRAVKQPVKRPVKKAPVRKRVVRRSPVNKFVRPENMF